MNFSNCFLGSQVRTVTQSRRFMSMFCLVVMSGLACLASAQTNSAQIQNIDSALDDTPFLSARGAGMSGALSTLADGIHAPYYNPAGIGGFETPKKNASPIRQLYFPYLGAAANPNMLELIHQFRTQGGATDKTVGSAIVDANAGKTEYGRVSALASITLKRLILVQAVDEQFSAVKSSGTTAHEGAIAANFRNRTISGAGFSLMDPHSRLLLGIFAYYDSQKLFSGNFNYSEIVNTSDRYSLISKNSVSYTGLPINVGLLWILGKSLRPSLAMVVHNWGGTKYKASSQPTTGAGAALPSSFVKEQDLDVGFSISPPLGKRGILNFLLEVDQLTEYDVSIYKKLRAAMELNLGGFGSDSLLGLRAGLNSVGLSYGVNLNLGLIQIEFASQAQDVGVGNARVLERRDVAIVSFNVAIND